MPKYHFYRLSAGLLLSGLTLAGCVDSGESGDSSPGTESTFCSYDTEAICADTQGCRWVEQIGCIPDEPLPGEPLPEDFSFAEAYRGALKPGAQLIGNGQEQASELYISQDGSTLCGRLSFELEDGDESAQVYIQVSARMLGDQVAIALRDPTCVPFGNAKLCDSWYQGGAEAPEKFVARAFLKEGELHLTPALPVARPLDGSEGKMRSGALFHATYMRPHDGFKPSESPEEEYCGD